MKPPSAITCQNCCNKSGRMKIEYSATDNTQSVGVATTARTQGSATGRLVRACGYRPGHGRPGGRRQYRRHGLRANRHLVLPVPTTGPTPRGRCRRGAGGCAHSAQHRRRRRRRLLRTEGPDSDGGRAVGGDACAAAGKYAGGRRHSGSVAVPGRLVRCGDEHLQRAPVA